MDFLFGMMRSAFWFVVVLGVLVFIHEFGHFITAKLFGMRVDVFSLGFGKKLFARTRGETEYRISMIPLGGYVKLAGEISFSGEPMPPSGEARDRGEFLGRPRWQRFLVLVMGATLNLVLAVALYWVAFMHGVERPAELSQRPAIGYVAVGSAAETAGLRTGDLIATVNGNAVSTWKDVQEAVFKTGKTALQFGIERGGEKVAVALEPHIDATTQEPSLEGVYTASPPIIRDIQSGYPAEKAGLKDGDRIVALNDEPILSIDRAVQVIHASLAVPIKVDVTRGEERITVTVTPVESQDPEGKKIGVIGFRAPVPVEKIKLAPVAAFAASVRECRTQAGLVFSLLKNLLKHEVSIKTLSGPIEIAKYSAKSAEMGFGWFIQFMAFISLQLGIVNLLPVPMLDGGQVFVLLTEGLIRRDLSLRLKERLNQVGLVMLLTLMAVVLFNDITKNIPADLRFW